MIAQLDREYLRARPTKVLSRLMCYAFFEGRPLTTRGRWINPLVFALFSMVKRMPALRKVSRPIYILGTGRSGTTVLGMVLSMHHECVFLNEPKAIWHAIHSGEDLIGNYSLGRACYRLGAGDVDQDMKRDAHRIYGSCLAATFSSRIVDKYPELIYRVPFVMGLFDDAQFVFLVRNGWDTCRSIERWSERLGQNVAGETHDWWGIDRRKWKLLVEQLIPEHADLAPHMNEIKSFTRHVDMAAVEWVVTMREGLALMKRYPDRVIEVRFEELSREPDGVLRNLRLFLGLSDDPVFDEYAKKTLHPVPSVEEEPLHPVIATPFAEMMKTLGYT